MIDNYSAQKNFVIKKVFFGNKFFNFFSFKSLILQANSESSIKRIKVNKHIFFYHSISNPHVSLRTS